MSAIAGICQLQHHNLNPDQGPGLMQQLSRYPADDARGWQGQGIFLGCRAQWITPQSLNEKLPFYDPERRLAITADAIIDNRSELFGQLQVPYEDRDTIPDSLLILLAYEKWGDQTPVHLIGDFAFMIWDERKRSLSEPEISPATGRSIFIDPLKVSLFAQLFIRCCLCRV